LDLISGISGGKGKANLYEEIKEEIQDTHQHIKSQEDTLRKSFDNFKDLVFRQQVFQRVLQMTGEEQEKLKGIDNESRAQVIQENLLAMRIMYIGGIVSSDHLAQFKRLIIRATRCQVFVHTFEINLPDCDKIVGDNYDERKHLFVLALQEGSILEDKVRRLCAGFSQICFDVPIDNMIQEINRF